MTIRHVGGEWYIVIDVDSNVLCSASLRTDAEHFLFVLRQLRSCLELEKES